MPLGRKSQVRSARWRRTWRSSAPASPDWPQRRVLERGGTSAVVLEARDRAGGRLESIDLGGGVWMDVGGQWIGPTQDRLAALAREFGAETFPTYTAGENTVEYRGRLVRYTGTIPKLGPHVLADVGQAMLRLDRMAAKVPPEAPWAAARAREWDSQTTWSWMRRNMATRAGRSMLEIAVKAVWAAMPADVSLLHLLFYIRSGGQHGPAARHRGRRPAGPLRRGSRHLAGRLGETLGDRLVLSAPVRRIEHHADGVTVVADGVELRARRAIVAVPPTLAGRISYDPPLPGYRDQLTQRMPMGAVIKCLAVYDEPFWRARGAQRRGRQRRRPGHDDVRQLATGRLAGGPGRLPGGSLGTRARSRRSRERRTAVLGALARVFGPRAAPPERYLDKSWADEEWSRGCYVGFTPPGVLTAFGPALRDPIGPIHWAGTETATVWNGYMDGAIQSGERAAREALAALRGTPAGGRPPERTGPTRTSAPRRASARARCAALARRAAASSTPPGTRRSRSSGAGGGGAARTATRLRSGARWAARRRASWRPRTGGSRRAGGPARAPGARRVLRSSRGGAVRPKNRPCISAADGAGSRLSTSRNTFG